MAYEIMTTFRVKNSAQLLSNLFEFACCGKRLPDSSSGLSLSLQPDMPGQTLQLICSELERKKNVFKLIKV
jgi:hypothetical protein